MKTINHRRLGSPSWLFSTYKINTQGRLLPSMSQPASFWYLRLLFLFTRVIVFRYSTFSKSSSLRCIRHHCGAATSWNPKEDLLNLVFLSGKCFPSFISTALSIDQQIHSFLWIEEICTKRFRVTHASTDLAVGGAIHGSQEKHSVTVPL